MHPPRVSAPPSLLPTQLQALHALQASFPVPDSGGTSTRRMLRRVGAAPPPATAEPAQAAPRKPAAAPAAPAPVTTGRTTAAVAAPVPARAMQPPVQHTRAPRQPLPTAPPPPSLDEAAVSRQLGEAAPISLSYLRRLVFAA